MLMCVLGRSWEERQGAADGRVLVLYLSRIYLIVR